MAKNYYKILGITDEEKALPKEEFAKVLKKKYREIAIKKHPDKLGDVSEAEKKKAEEEFKEASEAYETLLNHREEYDNPTSGFDFRQSGGPDFSSMNMEDIFKHFSGFGGFGFDGFGSMKQTQKVGSSIRITIPFTLEEAFVGVKKKIHYERYAKCTHCGGSGMTEQSRKKTCRTCGGTGNIFSSNGFMQTMRTCPTCGGNGYYIENPCSHCQGHGLESLPNEVEIEIPKGAMDGMVLTYNGMGNAAPRGEGSNGALQVVFKEVKHDKFERDGNDLYFDLHINVIDSILGCSTSVETLGKKKLNVKVPQGTSDGQMIRFKGYGMPNYATNNKGNMVGIVRLDIPSKLNDKEKDLLKQLKEQDNFKNLV